VTGHRRIAQLRRDDLRSGTGGGADVARIEAHQHRDEHAEGAGEDGRNGRSARHL